MHFIVLTVFILMILFAVSVIRRSGKKKRELAPVSVSHTYLDENVKFYQRLSVEDQQRFRKEAGEFLAAVTITPVNTVITELDRIFIAASAVIPMFAFGGWKYPHLEEVLVYDDHFNMDFQSADDDDRNIMGLVGTGAYKNKMLLSKNALQQGFFFSNDKSNTAIHEFVHLIDGADGDTDGVPKILMDNSYTLPWLDLIHREMEKMKEGESDINPYGYTNRQEFFAVAAEYFFEHPELFEEKHPELFAMMQQLFKTNKSEHGRFLRQTTSPNDPG